MGAGSLRKRFRGINSSAFGHGWTHDCTGRLPVRGGLSTSPEFLCVPHAPCIIPIVQFGGSKGISSPLGIERGLFSMYLEGRYTIGHGIENGGETLSVSR